METSGYAKGCPVATVALEVAAGNEPLRKICADVYDTWERTLATLLRADGRTAKEAKDLAATTLALIGGALVLSRARRDRTPADQAWRRLRPLLTH